MDRQGRERIGQEMVGNDRIGWEWGVRKGQVREGDGRGMKGAFPSLRTHFLFLLLLLTSFFFFLFYHILSFFFPFLPLPFLSLRFFPFLSFDSLSLPFVTFPFPSLSFSSLSFLQFPFLSFLSFPFLFIWRRKKNQKKGWKRNPLCFESRKGPPWSNSANVVLISEGGGGSGWVAGGKGEL